MIKLIATDMDGTLLNAKGQLPKDFFEVFRTMQSKKITFAAASGRQYFTLLENFKPICEEMLFIAENGTYIVYKGKELAVYPLKKEMAHRLIKHGRKLGVRIVLATSKGAYLESSEEQFISEVSKYYVKYEIVADLLKVEEEILKVTLCDFRGAEVYSYPAYQAFENEAQICVAGDIWLDIMAKGVNKGMAIRAIQEKLNIAYEETMVFGDYLNDLEMLQNAYYSYAMANAHPQLKEVARFSAKSNDENGVIEKIKEII